jgi:ribosomal protein S18 acetylase RimI-like enzyme
VHVEVATAADSRAIAEVHVGSWQQAYQGIVPGEHLSGLSVATRDAWWQEALRAGSPQVLVARCDERVVGFVAYGACRDDDAPPARGEIWALYVLSSHWSAGVGRALWLAALEHLRRQGYASVSLWVLSQNRRGIRFYTTAGFKADPASEKEFTLGGASLREVRLVFQDAV